MGLKWWVKRGKNATFEEVPAVSSKFCPCLSWEQAKGSGKGNRRDPGLAGRGKWDKEHHTTDFQIDKTGNISWSGYQQVAEEGGKGKGYECCCCHQSNTKKPHPTSNLHTGRIEGVSTPASDRISHLYQEKIADLKIGNGYSLDCHTLQWFHSIPLYLKNFKLKTIHTVT